MSGKPGGSNTSDVPEARRVKRAAFLLAVRNDRKVVLVPLLLLVLCTGLALWGVFASANAERRARIENAQNRADDKAQSIESELRACYLPVKVMQSFVTRYPDFPTLNATFASLTEELLSLTAAGSIANMQLAPLGVVSAVQPLKGNEKAIGHDLLSDPKNRDVALLTIASRNLTLAGPYMLVQGYMGAPARYPIYVHDVDANETFGMPDDATNCSVCYDPTTRTKFWGFATVMIDWDKFVYGIVRIDELRGQGLRYQLWRRDDTLPEHKYLLAGQQADLANPVTAHIQVPNNVWVLEVEDDRGWMPTYLWPIVAMVIVMSLVLAVLVGMALVQRAQQKLLLREVLSANEKLEEAAKALLCEKERMEALLGRQYDLIECLGGDPRSAAEAAPGQQLDKLAANNPADKIERMRAKLLNGLRPSAAGHSGALSSRRSLHLAPGGGGGGGAGGGPGGGASDARISAELELKEMIGEGTFGKVFRGLWRGTEVAIKTIILPTNMSGKEKRERMAVMEAAISSSLAHPNVVATYTYQIKPLKDSSEGPGRPSEDITASAIIVGGANVTTAVLTGSQYQHLVSSSSTSRGSGGGAGGGAGGGGGGGGFGGSPAHGGGRAKPPGDPLAPFKEDADEAAAKGVYSYEVQLVIEYCDKGCLREALDMGVFFGSAGLNYPAILDTAADVAKAMLHLHLNDVLHGDLKADNVMLKSCGGVGRGVLAKVADFGLAVKMDNRDKTHMSGLFQGTPTHMAPEVMLHGQVSKAADVYAFGVTLWEMFTGGHPYKGVPGALLGHSISREGKRPVFPLGTPGAFKELAERCWAPDPGARPAFDEILSILTDLRTQQPDPTPPLTYTPLTAEQRREQRRREREGPAASLRAKLSEAARASVSAPLPRLHHHYRRNSDTSGGRAGEGGSSVDGSAARDAHAGQAAFNGLRQASNSSDGAKPRSTSRSGSGSGSSSSHHHHHHHHHRRSRSRSRKGDDPIIMVGNRNVSLSNAITSKSVVLEPICEARNEGDYGNDG
ncbi:hypothetical protein HYH02_004852 [Chlamydomonas schloesseri]|uniref:Protein kinase domain-containing protein n=1 Tax=Chlamydomonas schloesseri TaxID=2026947 RepID=A0A835WMZ6_9CHLO|nr:hypothetical protein HYH02_004852 [Chlamydomonas schloesseri]|eukprot:KAG2450347.1 hypothetical protein HYH02_004852 [Chlamydomonas schloesseri]